MRQMVFALLWFALGKQFLGPLVSVSKGPKKKKGQGQTRRILYRYSSFCFIISRMSGDLFSDRFPRSPPQDTLQSASPVVIQSNNNKQAGSAQLASATCGDITYSSSSSSSPVLSTRSTPTLTAAHLQREESQAIVAGRLLGIQLLLSDHHLYYYSTYCNVAVFTMLVAASCTPNSLQLPRTVSINSSCLERCLEYSTNTYVASQHGQYRTTYWSEY